MQIEPSLTLNESRHFSLTLRDVTAVLFRQKRILLISFVIIVLLVVLSGALTRSYMAEMKILVRRERVDPVVTSQPNAPPQVVQEEITESELNSEVELLNSQDLLRKVVIANSLQSKQTSWGSWFAESSEEVGIARAVRQLARTLKAEPLRKSNIISVSFESSDAVLGGKTSVEAAHYLVDGIHHGMVLLHERRDIGAHSRQKMEMNVAVSHVTEWNDSNSREFAFASLSCLSNKLHGF